MSGATGTYPRFRVSQWIDTSEEAMNLPQARIIFGIEAQTERGGNWMHCKRGSEALLFEKLPECQAEIARLQKIQARA